MMMIIPYLVGDDGVMVIVIILDVYHCFEVVLKRRL